MANARVACGNRNFGRVLGGDRDLLRILPSAARVSTRSDRGASTRIGPQSLRLALTPSPDPVRLHRCCIAEVNLGLLSRHVEPHVLRRLLAISNHQTNRTEEGK